MKKLAKTTTLILAIVLSIYCTNAAFGNDGKVKFQERVKLSEQNDVLEKAYAFCVTADDLFLIPDYNAGNVKIYKRKGSFLEIIGTIGQKGYGKNEFVKPKFCTINENEGKFLVMDYGLKKIFIYDRKGMAAFKRIREINCPRVGYDMQLIGDTLYISGYRPDENENPYDLYSINLETGRIDYLLPSYEKYGLNSLNEYKKEYRNKPDIYSIGVKGWLAVQNDTVYFSWEGNLKVHPLNTQTREAIEWDGFGEKTNQYTQPEASNTLITLKGQPYPGNQDAIDNEKAKMSYVTSIFTNNDNFILVYNGPGKSNFRLQYYTLEGEYLKKEVAIPEKPDKRMWFNKKTNTLYSLTGGNDSDYYILKYQIPMVKK